MLNSSPAKLYISDVSKSIPSFKFFPNSTSLFSSICIPFHCIFAKTSTVGISIFWNNSIPSISFNFEVKVSDNSYIPNA